MTPRPTAPPAWSRRHALARTRGRVVVRAPEPARADAPERIEIHRTGGAAPPARYTVEGARLAVVRWQDGAPAPEVTAVARVDSLAALLDALARLDDDADLATADREGRQ
jgi:hypothetical protein